MERMNLHGERAPGREDAVEALGRDGLLGHGAAALGSLGRAEEFCRRTSTFPFLLVFRPFSNTLLPGLLEARCQARAAHGHHLIKHRFLGRELRVCPTAGSLPGSGSSLEPPRPARALLPALAGSLLTDSSRASITPTIILKFRVRTCECKHPTVQQSFKP